MDLMGLVNSAIASSDTEANSGLMGSLLGSLNDAPVENNKIGSIASNLQGLLQQKNQNQADASSLMGVLQTVATTGAVEKLMGSDQIGAIAQKAGASPEMVKTITPLVAQFLVKGSNAKGGGLIQKVLSGEVDLGQMAGLIGMAQKFMTP
ncbi:DUF937 domain-containing protein [Leptolyngbya sp. PCC 6406]|uniref:DUF937 domain-containing protein n=1 Tax=Leptolyngbya sp. PCC 6406 TaxID=1173264 RepID=UPI0002AC4DD6|nr:DUF937 domain-containing protein [Leptolyngbya sp. PCC 6406]